MAYQDLLVRAKSDLEKNLLNENTFKKELDDRIKSVEFYVEKLKLELDKEDSSKVEETVKEIVEGFKKSARFLEDKNKKYIEEAIAIVTGANAKLLDILDNHARKRILFSSPTKYYFINSLINSIKMLIEGVGTDGILKAAIQSFHNNTDPIKKQLNSIYVNQIDIEQVKEAATELDVSFKLFDGVFEHLDKFFKVRSDRLLEVALKDAHAAGYGFEKANEDFQRWMRGKDSIVCIKCGNDNPKSSRTCQKCNFKLPQVVEEEEFAEDIIGQEEQEKIPTTRAIEKILKAVRDVYENKITTDEFVQVLDEIKQKMNKLYNDISKIENLEQLSPGLPYSDSDTMQLIKKDILGAVNRFIEGLALMQNYQQSADVYYLEEGVEILKDASKTLISYLSAPPA